MDADYEMGQACGMLKDAAAALNTMAMRGQLYHSKSGWILLNVPNAFIRGIFDTLQEPGIELPLNDDGALNGHISVIRKSELEQIGGPEKITERGHMFKYQLGPVQTCVPDGWEGVSRVWFVKVHSPDLEKLRKSYGLSALPNNDKYNFHITVARRRTNVLKPNTVSKAAASPSLASMSIAQMRADLLQVVDPVDGLIAQLQDYRAPAVGA